MPSNSGKRTYEMTTNKWGGRNQRRDDRRPNVQNRISGGSRLMVNPWENGVAPGMQPSLLGQGSFSQPFQSSYLMNSGMNRGSFEAANYGGGFGSGSNKMSRLDRMGGFDDQRGRGLLPSPSNAPLLGVAPPQAYVPPGRGTDFLQRMGNPWDSFRSGGPRGLNSGYYPSNRMRQDNNSRKFLKAKRPQYKSSTSSTSKSGSSKEVRGGGGRNNKGSTSSKSPSFKEKGEDKDSSSSAHSKSGKQGDTPIKRERSDKDDDEEEEEEEDDDEVEKEEGAEDRETRERDEEKTEQDKEKDEDKRERERQQQQEDPFPVEALYCHICELDSFSTKKGYIRHLQGITHAKMAEMFHAKNAATLELLNISAKLAEMRQRDKVLRRTGKKNQPVMKTTEQMLVQKWLKVGSCCGTKYKSPFGLEEHKLSIHHLKAKFTQKQKQEETEKPEKSEKTENEDEESKVIIKKEPEEPIVEESLDEVIRLSALLEKAKKEAEETPMTMEDFPVYNPGSMMGLDYVSKELRFRCQVCKNQGFRTLDSHCQSYSHYDNIASHLNKIEDVKREEKRKKEEAEAEAKREQERLEREKEKEEELKREKEESETKAKMEVPEEEEEQEGNISSEYITLDQCPKDKSDDEEMDEDAILLGEEEERILNAKEEEEEEEEEQQEEEEEVHEGDVKDAEEDEEMMDGAIFEEVGEKIDFEGDMKKQIENGDEKEEEEEEEEEEEVEEAQPPQKKSAVTPRARRGRSRGRKR